MRVEVPAHREWELRFIIHDNAGGTMSLNPEEVIDLLTILGRAVRKELGCLTKRPAQTSQPATVPPVTGTR